MIVLLLPISLALNTGTIEYGTSGIAAERQVQGGGNQTIQTIYFLQGVTSVPSIIAVIADKIITWYEEILIANIRNFV